MLEGAGWMAYLRLDGRRLAVFIAMALLLAMPALFPWGGDAAECDPTCDSCHSYHDRVYYAYLDVTDFSVPATLDGTDRKQVTVTTHLYGNVEMGYTSIFKGWIELTSLEDRVAIEEPRQTLYYIGPGFQTYYWNVTGRLEGTDRLHVEFWGQGHHFVWYEERADSGGIVVTNPVNAAPRVGFSQPDGDSDVGDASYSIGIATDDPNADHLLVDLYWDMDRDRTNGQTLIVSGLLDPTTYTWDTRALPDGWYWLHADVDDQRGGEGSGTSLFPVIVTHGNRAPYVELTTPFKGDVVMTPMVWLQWSSTDLDGDSLTYEVYVGRQGDELELVGTTDQLRFHYRPPDNAKLQWTVIPRDDRVKGWCRSGVWAFTTDISYPVNVRLETPANGSTVAGPNVKLIWYGHDEDFERIYYDIYLDTGSASTLVAKDWDNPAGMFYFATDLEPGQTYSWRVVGRNPYSPSSTSETWRFTVAAPEAPGASLLGEEVLVDGSVSLDWGPLLGRPAPASYDVHLVSPDGGDLVVLANTTLTQTVVAGLVEDAMYRWYVLPRAADGREGVCEPQYREFTIDLNSPPVASALSVATISGGVRIQWALHDPDGDPAWANVYVGRKNATTLVASGLSATSIVLGLEGGMNYTCRVVPFDSHGPGVAVELEFTVPKTGYGLAPEGSLVAPLDTVIGPLVLLEWNASDPMGRPILYDVYVDAMGGDPLSVGPHATNVTRKNLTIGPYAAGTRVAWAVVARVEMGGSAVLGTARFNVTDIPALERPVLEVDVTDSPRCFEAVTFHTVLPSSLAGIGDVELWYDFGDGNVSGWTRDDLVTHTYMQPGTYNVSVVARDKAGRTTPAAVMEIPVAEGDRASEDALPGPGALAAMVAVLGASACSTALRRGRRRPCGRDRGVG